MESAGIYTRDNPAPIWYTRADILNLSLLHGDFP
jgi:hypothetical protein